MECSSPGTTESKPEYEKIVKDPYVMEFLQIQPDTHVTDPSGSRTNADVCELLYS